MKSDSDMDQINVRLTRDLAGKGEAIVYVIVIGSVANLVHVSIK